MNKGYLKIGIIEDNQVLLQNYADFLEMQEDFMLAFACDSMESFEDLKNSSKHQLIPDIVLLDIQLPGITGIEGIPIIKKRFPDVQIIMLTAYDDKKFILTALEKGASGYLVKTMSLAEIRRSLLGLSAGEVPISPSATKKIILHLNGLGDHEFLKVLTSREKEIVDCLTDGCTYKEAASRLGVTVHTINQHLKNIYLKLNVNSKAELVAKILKKY